MKYNSVVEALICGKARTHFGLFRSNPDSVSLASVPSVPPELTSHYDLGRVFRAKDVVLSRIEFNVYDQTVLDAVTPDPALLKVYESLALDNDSYTQARFIGSPIPDFQPNYLLPQVLINGTNIFGGVRSGDGTGFPIPFEWEPWMRFSNVTNLTVRAGCYQRIVLDDNSIRFVSYSVYCYMEFVLFE